MKSIYGGMGVNIVDEIDGTIETAIRWGADPEFIVERITEFLVEYARKDGMSPDCLREVFENAISRAEGTSENELKVDDSPHEEDA